MIDLHTHLLPGVDDGSRTPEQSIEVLQRFAHDGVEVLACTPHLRATAAHRAPIERHRALLAELVARAPARPRLELGWEIMLDAPGVDLRAPHLHLGGSSAVLVEFPRMGVPPGATRELYRLRMSGIVPVLAHPERYPGTTVERVEEWRGVGAVMQVTAVMLIGTAPMSKLARRLLEEGLVDCIASDNHGDTRALAVAHRWLREIGAEEQAQLLTHVNAERLLADQPVLPVSPIPPVNVGMLSRLKSLFFGR